MKVLQINSIYPIKSTGRIVKELAEIQAENGIEPYVACGQSTLKAENVYSIGSPIYNKLNILMTRLFGKHGFYNKLATKKLLKWIDEVNPDVIHLHNIHGHYINVRLLFEYIKSHNIPVVWTLHDCWSFTGHCAHFDYIGCGKWKTGCRGNCPMQKSYPVSWFFNRSAESFKDKKQLFTSLEKMHVATPSDWLKELCEESFLGRYPVTTVYNGIDAEVFAPASSQIRKELNIEDKFVILGCVKSFSDFKGGGVFLKLSKRLEKDEVIVLLGLEETEEKLPENVIALRGHFDDKKLAEIYSMADVFVNPTLQGTFGLVNIESLACKTPVVSYKTGGTVEQYSEGCGFWVDKGDEDALFEAVMKVKSGDFDADKCRLHALDFQVKNSFAKFVDIYNDILS